jgi:hypothetical protein
MAPPTAAARRDICSIVRFSFPRITLDTYGALTFKSLASLACVTRFFLARIIRARPTVNSNKASDGQSPTEAFSIFLRITV